MKMDLPLSVVVDIVFLLKRRQMECSELVKPNANKSIEKFTAAALGRDRDYVDLALADAEIHYRNLKVIQ